MMVKRFEVTPIIGSIDKAVSDFNAAENERLRIQNEALKAVLVEFLDTHKVVYLEHDGLKMVSYPSCRHTILQRNFVDNDNMPHKDDCLVLRAVRAIGSHEQKI